MKQILLFTFILSSVFGIAQQQRTLVLKPSGINGKDAQVYSLNAQANYGSIFNLLPNTWTNRGVLGNIRCFIEFDLTTLPPNASLDSAFLKLYYDPTNSVNYQTHQGNNDMEVKRVSNAWSESTINWVNQPATTRVNRVIVPPFSSNTQDYRINVTALLNDILASSNYGFMLKMLSENGSLKASIFASSDHANSALHPELIMKYNLTTSIESSTLNLSDELNVYPNPSHGLLNFDFLNRQELSTIEIEVVNLRGEVQNVAPLTVDAKMDLSSLAKGVYFLKLSNESDLVYLKRIVLY